MISPPQYRKMMKSYSKHQEVGRAAQSAGVDRKTARKYVQGAPGPQEPREPREWRTHPDAFSDVWREVEIQLQQEPKLQAKTLFAALQRRHPGQFLLGQRRSFERRVRRWKLEHGQEPPVVFRQEHRPGESLQLDWWDANELGIEIAGEPYRHKLVAVVLPYSNWQWARPARSESFLSLKSGLQAALWELGKVPGISQTDQSSTATHAKGKGQRGREFNERYLGLLAHYGMKPRTIALSSPEQNGDVESAHRHLKEALDQGLRLRGSRKFETMEAYEQWLEEMLRVRNRERQPALERELEQMQELPAIRLPEYEELTAWVSREALVRVGRQAYSVPARYIGQQVRVRAEESWLSFYCAQECIERTPRQPGTGQGVYVNWRHVLPQLRRKPGAMTRWRHRASLFPNATWRRAFDEMLEREGERRAERAYLGLLALALDHGVSPVESLLRAWIVQGTAWTLEQVQAALGCAPEAAPEKVIIVDFQADLSAYDTLLENAKAEAITDEEPKEVQHGR
jgi:transposase